MAARLGSTPSFFVSDSADQDGTLCRERSPDPVAINSRRMVKMTDADFSRQDIAELNLRCAAGLPGAKDLDIGRSLVRLERWTDHVSFATQRALENKSSFPEYANWSESRYRALMVQIALQNHLGLKSDHKRMSQPYDGSDSRDMFIHAVLVDGYSSICTTAPVIYAAIGRRLGYPIKLVKTKQHIFCRWDDPEGERFNIEATNPGFISNADEYYRTWPFPWTEFERRSGCWLKNLTSRQELALFLDLRGTCWLECLQSEYAADCFSAACKLDNSDPSVEQRWAMVTLLHPAIQQLRRQNLSDTSQTLMATFPRPREKWQQLLYPMAQEWLDRIIRNHRNKSAAALRDFTNTEIVTAM